METHTFNPHVIAMYEITIDIKAHAGYGEVCITVAIIVPTVTCVNTCPSARKLLGKSDAMQRFATSVAVVGGISGATLTSVFTGRIYAVGRELQLNVF
jgi:hypothetical protein